MKRDFNYPKIPNQYEVNKDITYKQFLDPLNNPENPNYLKQENFLEILVGFIEGDGSFISHIPKLNGIEKNHVVQSINLSQSYYNLGMLYYFYQRLNLGYLKFALTKKEATLAFHKKFDIKELLNIFSNLTFITTKNYQFLKFKAIWTIRELEYDTNTDISNNTSIMAKIKQGVIELQDKPKDYIAPAFLDSKYSNTFEYNNKILYNPINLYWLIGFIMAEGCFHITTRKDITFDISQYLDHYVIYGIRQFLNIVAKPSIKKEGSIHCSTQNLHNIGNLLQLIDGKMFGMKALELLLFKQAYHYRTLRDLDSKTELKRIQALKAVLAEIRETDYMATKNLEIDLIEHHKHYEGLYNKIIKALGEIDQLY